MFNAQNQHDSPMATIWQNFSALRMGDIPFVILLISVLQIILLMRLNVEMRMLLMFISNKPTEIWRCITYMFLHEDWSHLLGNIVIQMIAAFFLERRHKRIKILFLYITSGVIGVLMATCFAEGVVLGASGAACGLLIANVTDLFFNRSLYSQCETYVLIVITIIIVLADIQAETLHPVVIHVGGGLSGMHKSSLLFYQQLI
nr:PREDICTED: RHOMBOID-like protein 7 isoform X2 [Tribolium castaneum]|eukprot:XP_008196082.1 PREDICTED: RHOMBOID-like protein 7 isoform X2 [Tribolium castaneum]